VTARRRLICDVQRRGSANAILCRKAIDLASGRGKCIFDRRLGVLMPSIIKWCMADHDAFVRRNCQPDVDLEAGAVAMLVTRGDHLYAAACNALIVCFQPLYFTQYLGAGKFRRFGTFESDLWGYLHKNLSSSVSVDAGKTCRYVSNKLHLKGSKVAVPTHGSLNSCVKCGRSFDKTLLARTIWWSRTDAWHRALP
jgi:hypothetical protein